MSVLYKALQKAQKENEQRQPSAAAPQAAGGTTSAMRLALPAVNWRIAGLGAAVLLAVVIGAGFFLFQESPSLPAPSRAPAPQAAMQPSAPQPAAPQAAATPQTLPATVPAPSTQVAEAAPTEDAPPAASETDAQPSTDGDQPVDLMPAKPKATAPKAPPAPAPANKPMPQLAVDSPARMLSPPINIKRDEYDFSGVGDTVQVRRVSQQAQDNVTAGYNALVRGDHDMALSFYERALQQEPRSVLAQLGRGAALQKLGRLDEARGAYERVLKLDPQSREALTNLTAIVAEREPGEALKRLQALEREYPTFSPIKAQMGLTYARLGNFPPALDYLRKAVSLTPDAPMYNYNLALVLDRLNLHDQAAAIYERVLATAAAGRLPPDIPVADIERRVRFLRTK